MAEHKYVLVGSKASGATMGVILGPAHYVGFGDEFVADESVVAGLKGQFVFQDLGPADQVVAEVVATVETATPVVEDQNERGGE